LDAAAMGVKCPENCGSLAWEAIVQDRALRVGLG
jgi:hypothetical protein